MIREEHHNILSIVASRMISRIGDIMFDFANNTFLAGLNPTSLEKWLVYAIVITNVILAFMSAFSGPSYKAFTKEIVKKDSIS